MILVHVVLEEGGDGKGLYAFSKMPNVGDYLRFWRAGSFDFDRLQVSAVERRLMR